MEEEGIGEEDIGGRKEEALTRREVEVGRIIKT